MHQRIYEIKNVHFLNKGAELMLKAIHTELGRIDSSAAIALRPGKSAAFAQRMQYAAFQKIGGTKGPLNWSRAAELIPGTIKRNLGLVTDRDLFGILDASGYAYGGDWNPAMLAHAADQAKRMQRKGGIFIALPQAFGVFDTAFKIRKIKEMTAAADIVFARDEKSREHLAAAKVEINKIAVFPDFTATVPPSEVELPCAGYACIVPNTKVISKMNRNNADKTLYLSFLEKCILHLRKKGLIPYFLLHHFKDDSAICDMVNSRLMDPVILINQPDPRKIKHILGNATVNICSRYHACVSSLSEGVPTLATSWSHKYEMLYNDYNLSELIIKDYEKAEKVADYVISNHQILCERLHASTKQVICKINEMWSLVEKILASKISIENNIHE
jgi:hypothetical protein